MYACTFVTLHTKLYLFWQSVSGQKTKCVKTRAYTCTIPVLTELYCGHTPCTHGGTVASGDHIHNHRTAVLYHWSVNVP